jgi:hypothetical protein
LTIGLPFFNRYLVSLNAYEKKVGIGEFKHRQGMDRLMTTLEKVQHDIKSI